VITTKQIKAIIFSGSAKAIFLISAIFVFELIFILPASTVLQRNGFLSSVLPAILVDYANSDRVSQNVIPLRASSLLSEAAQLKAEDMAKRGYFSHAGPNGEKPWIWLDRVGYDYSTAGENLAVDFVDSKDINDAWMNSPLHKGNILKNDFQEIGVGVARGVYEGHNTIFVVQFFGSSKEDKKNLGVAPASGRQAMAARSLTGAVFSLNLMWEKLSDVFNLKHSAWWQRVVSAPCQTANVINSFLLLVVLALLALKIKNNRRFSQINLVLLVLVGVILLASIFFLNSVWFLGTIK